MKSKYNVGDEVRVNTKKHIGALGVVVQKLYYRGDLVYTVKLFDKLVEVSCRPNQIKPL